MQVNIISFSHLPPYPAYLHTLHLFLDIVHVTDYSSVVSCIKNEQQKIIWPDFIKKITVEYMEKWQERNVLKINVRY